MVTSWTSLTSLGWLCPQGKLSELECNFYSTNLFFNKKFEIINEMFKQ